MTAEEGKKRETASISRTRKEMLAMTNKLEVLNIDDWESNFWGKKYVIELDQCGAYGVCASCEQDAFDILIDYCSEHYPGLIMTDKEQAEEEFIDDYICGGNEGRYLSVICANIRISEYETWVKNINAS